MGDPSKSGLLNGSPGKSSGRKIKGLKFLNLYPLIDHCGGASTIRKVLNGGEFSSLIILYNVRDKLMLDLE